MRQLELYKAVLSDSQLKMLIKELATGGTERAAMMAKLLQIHLNEKAAK